MERFCFPANTQVTEVLGHLGGLPGTYPSWAAGIVPSFLVEHRVITEGPQFLWLLPSSDISSGQVLSRLWVFRRYRRTASVSSARFPVNSPSFRVLWVTVQGPHSLTRPAASFWDS